MRSSIVVVASCALAAAVAFPSIARAQYARLPTTLIALDSDEGAAMLARASARADYLPLADRYVTQDHGAYCGVASAVMVLNALPIPAPVDRDFDPAREFTQTNVFVTTRSDLLPTAIQQGGMTLDQLGDLLQTHPAHARVVHASDATLDAFRADAVANLARKDDYVIVNYDRAGVGQDPLGHISPLAAYDDKSDRFLIMDVARFKYPPVWASASALFDAMKTTDRVSGRSRGYALVDRAAAAPGPGPARTARSPRTMFIGMLVAVFAAGLALGSGGAWGAMRVMRRRRGG